MVVYPFLRKSSETPKNPLRERPFLKEIASVGREIAMDSANMEHQTTVNLRCHIGSSTYELRKVDERTK
jgi:hypothetical protein